MAISFASIGLLFFFLKILVIFCFLFVHKISFVHFFGLSLKKKQTGAKNNQSTNKKPNKNPAALECLDLALK